MMGELEEAIALYQRGLAIRQVALGTDHPGLALSLTNIGLLRVKAGRPEDALAPLRRGAELIEAAYGENDQLVTALGALGHALAANEQIDEATAVYDRAIAIGQRVEAADLGTMLIGRAELHLTARSPADAVPLLRHALETWAAQTGEDPAHEGYARRALAMALWDLDRHDEALAEARLAVQLLAEPDPAAHTELVRWLEDHTD
jgi:tetratricopeptide (TPR) repeat protein